MQQNNSMERLTRRSSSISQTKFVLVHGQSKQEEPIRWHWLTQRFKKQQQFQQEEITPHLTYSQKKSILCELKGSERASLSSFKIRQGFSRREKVRVTSTAERVVSTAASTSKSLRRSLQPFIYLNSNEEQLDIPTINLQALKEQLVGKIVQARKNGRQLLVALFAKRTGLRFKLFHAFVEWCECGKSTHGHKIQQVSEQVRQQVKTLTKIPNELYYFSLEGSPLHNLQDISAHSVLLVDCVPKLHLSPQILVRIRQQAQGISHILTLPAAKLAKDNYQRGQDDQEEIYDWQRITSVKEYVNKIAQNPKDMLQPRQQSVSELQNWYNQRFREEQLETKTKDSNKNPLFESKTHFPNEIVNKKLLAAASDKLEGLQSTKNRHKYVPGRLELMMETVRREGLPGKTLPMQSSNKVVEGSAVGKKHLMMQLDRKNTLLSSQNIPYLIEKYGLNRFEVYNLYNLYKSFEKVSLLRQPGNQGEVMRRGVDRQTFEVGLKGLDMNPGQQLIRNICYFGDFISWQQFIKIISISLRKTPQEKLTAILKGISSQEDGFLTRHQISLMIGNSLQKLFDREEAQLREYFTGVAMRQLGGIEGKVSIENLKEKVLGRGSENLTMVSFLILNT